MKDDAQDSHMPADLPPCPKSSQCLPFIDELGGHMSPHASTQEDAQDEQLLAELRTHVPTCPTCTATLASANKAIAEQRRALHAILDEGEQKVPSTTVQIMAAIRREQRTAGKTLVGASNHVQNMPPTALLPQIRDIETPLPIAPRHRFRSGLALAAVAAILIISFGLLSYMLPRPSATTSTGKVTSTTSTPLSTATRLAPVAPAITPEWSEVIMTYQINGTTVIANYDPVNNASAILTTSPYAVTSVAGVSHHGDKVLYSTYDGFKTSYYLYPQSTTNAFYTTPDKNSSAVWSTDDRFIFINTSEGIAQIDVQTHNVTPILPSVASTTLNNYRDGYLYYVKGYNGQAYSSEGVLNRVNVTNGVTQQITSTCQHGANFWLSPGGVNVYYTCLDQQNTLLYTVKSDGTHSHVFRYNAGNVIGYEGDEGSPLTLTNSNRKYQVMELDLYPPFKDKVLLYDVAPGAATVVASDIAVAPYGHALIAKGTYSTSDTTPAAQLWYSDLVTSKRQPLKLPQDARSPSAIGWDKLHVPSDTLVPTVQPTNTPT